MILVAYGTRSHSRNLQAHSSTNGRPSPDDFGLGFHITTPLQDSYGTIQASSLHYVATTKGAFVPDIDPAKHTLMINGQWKTPPGRHHGRT